MSQQSSLTQSAHSVRQVLTAYSDTTKPARRPRRPKLGDVAKQVGKAAIPVTRYEVKPDGSIVVVTGMPEPLAPENPWSLDEFQRKETKQ